LFDKKERIKQTKNKISSGYRTVVQQSGELLLLGEGRTLGKRMICKKLIEPYLYIFPFFRRSVDYIRFSKTWPGDIYKGRDEQTGRAWRKVYTHVTGRCASASIPIETQFNLHRFYFYFFFKNN
jgi:hypothetical protein